MVAHKRLPEVDLACGQSASLLKEVPGIVGNTIKKTQALICLLGAHSLIGDKDK